MPSAIPDRLSALDAAFLDLETARSPLTVGWTMRFGGSAPSVAALRRHIDGRLGAVPRFRRRVVRPAFGIGDAHWADDVGFDIARHVGGLRLAAPAGPAELRELAGVLLSASLDPHRPLWRMTLVTDLQDGGFALIGQAHHALVDGMAAVEVAMLLFDELEGAATASAARWAPSRSPSATRVLADGAGSRLHGGAGAAQALVRAAAGGPAALRDAAGQVARIAAPAPPTALDRSATSERRVAYAATPLSDIRDAARRHGATVNDALLAGAASAVGAALRRRGEHHESIRAVVPASVRTGAQGAAQHGNRISFLAIDLPVGEPDPARALQLVSGRTRARKLAGDAGAADALLRAADLLPAPARRAGVRAAAQAANFTVIVSNVPGPPVTLGLLGRELQAVWPAVPLIDGHALTIGAVSYAGRLHAGLFADATVVPDAALIAQDLERALDALRVLPAPAATPWRARARRRRDAVRAAG